MNLCDPLRAWRLCVEHLCGFGLAPLCLPRWGEEFDPLRRMVQGRTERMSSESS